MEGPARLIGTPITRSNVVVFVNSPHRHIDPSTEQRIKRLLDQDVEPVSAPPAKKAKLKRGEKSPPALSPLARLPPELHGLIAEQMDAQSLATFRLVSKTLNTYTKDTPKMTGDELNNFNDVFEKRVRRHRRPLLSMACSKCRKCLVPGVFSDSDRKKTVAAGRVCISCKIRSGYKHVFRTNGVESFGCRGCLKAKPLEEENHFLGPIMLSTDHRAPDHESVSFPALGARWCEGCWLILENYHQARGWYPFVGTSDGIDGD